VKIVVREEGTERARELWEASARRVSTGLVYVEGRAAIAQAQRIGRFGASGGRTIRARFEGLFEFLELVDASQSVVRAAGALAERHALRAYDAVHLASALALADPDVVVATWDQNLRAAAAAEGFTVAA
jgi:predicted nucleic acid-binding protein